MSRFGRFERFEVKNEMRDVKEINQDNNKQTGGESSSQTQEEIKKETNKIGFDDEIDFVKNDLTEELRVANAQVEAELEQYYNDEITPEELKAYLVSKITEIYGKRLNQCNVLIDSFVEGFLNYYQFNGAESYRQLVRITEETIIDITNRMEKSKNIEEVSEKTGIHSISEEEAKKIVSVYQRMSNQSELSANAYISTQAKKLGIDKSDLISFVLTKGKETINSPDKVLHYHRTSIQSFSQIMQTGYLLNRKNMELNGIDTSRLSGSSSANVQFSRDIYDSNGKLQVEGYNKESNLGANSTDIVFVMGPELMQEDTYNCLSVYPTVEKADIQRCCVAILVKDSIIQMQVEQLLKEHNISINTILQENFNRNIILEELSKNNSIQQEKDAGFILKSINGRDISTTSIMETKQQVNQISKSQANTIYKEYIKYRACLKDKTQFLSFSEYAKQLHNIENMSNIIVDEELQEEMRGISR